MYDVILKNGLLVDGKGGKPYKANIAVFSDSIALIQIKRFPGLEQWLTAPAL